MARNNKGIGGFYSGKVGDITYVNRLGQSIMRRSIATSTSKSPLQQRNRNRFSVTSLFCKQMSDVVKSTYSSMIGNGRSALSAFQSHVLRNGLSESAQDTKGAWSCSILPERISVSIGNAEPLQEAAMSCEGNEITVTWSPEVTDHGHTSDLVHVVMYCKGRNQVSSCMRSETCTRKQGTRTRCIPAEWRGEEVHVWVFVETPESHRFSNSQYLGAVTYEIEDEPTDSMDFSKRNTTKETTGTTGNSISQKRSPAKKDDITPPKRE